MVFFFFRASSLVTTMNAAAKAVAKAEKVMVVNEEAVAAAVGLGVVAEKVAVEKEDGEVEKDMKEAGEVKVAEVAKVAAVMTGAIEARRPVETFSRAGAIAGMDVGLRMSPHGAEANKAVSSRQDS